MNKDVEFGDGVIVAQPSLVNLYGCKIGAGTKIAAFVEIQRGVTIGRNVKIEPFAFIPEGVTIEDYAFIGPGVLFTNHRYPQAVDQDGNLLNRGDWKLEPTLVCSRASIGAGAIILPGVTIGERAFVAAGAVVRDDVRAGETSFGLYRRPVAKYEPWAFDPDETGA